MLSSGMFGRLITMQMSLTTHSCYEHFSKHPNPRFNLDLLQALKEIQVFRVLEIFTTYTLDAYGSEISVKTNNNMRLEETTAGQLELLILLDEDYRGETFALRFTKELIAFLRLPEAKSWQTIMAVMTLAPEKAKSFLHQQGISTSNVLFPPDSSESEDDKRNPKDTDIDGLHATFGGLEVKPKEAENNPKTGEKRSTPIVDTLRSRSPTFKSFEGNDQSLDISHLNAQTLQNLCSAVEKSQLSPHPTIPSSDGLVLATINKNKNIETYSEMGREPDSERQYYNSERRVVLYSFPEKEEARKHEEGWSSDSGTLVAF
jgi:hypothetical protein